MAIIASTAFSCFYRKVFCRCSSLRSVGPANVTHYNATPTIGPRPKREKKVVVAAASEDEDAA